jgi:hypothetical protein
LVKYLAINTGGILSYQNVTQILSLSFRTFKRYLDALERSYLVIRVPPFFKNKTKEIVKSPKVFFLDTGLRNVIARSFPTELDGALFENYVLTELIKMGLVVKYWRTKSNAEVDFVVETDNGIIPIEVKLKAGPDRIERGMRSFITE